MQTASLALRPVASLLQGHTRVNETQLAYRHTLALTKVRISTQDHHRGTPAKGACCVSEHVPAPSRVDVAAGHSRTRMQQDASDTYRTSTRRHQTRLCTYCNSPQLPTAFDASVNQLLGSSWHRRNKGSNAADRPNLPKTMLNQLFLASTVAALHAPNLQVLQRGLHTRLAASSRRRTKINAPPQHTESPAGTRTHDSA